jgi:hypothetical protein
MKNKKVTILIFAVAILSLIGIYAFTPAHAVETSNSFNLVSFTDSTDTKTYTCPMHPEVISDKPGKCTKCGMALELIEDDSKKDEKKDAGHNHKSHKGCKGH